MYNKYRTGSQIHLFFVRNCSSVSKIQLHAHILNFREYTLEVIFAYSFSKVAYYVHYNFIYRDYDMEVVVGDYKFKFVKWASISVHKRYAKVQRVFFSTLNV